MKKIKKYFGFIFVAAFASILGLAAFLSNHQQHVEKKSSEEIVLSNEIKSSEAIPLAARSAAVTDDEINDYIASKDEDALNFYQWFISTYDWKHYTNSTTDHPFLDIYAADEDGFVDYSTSMPTLEFKKGNVYLFNGYETQATGYKDYQMSDTIVTLYNLKNYKSKYYSYSSCESLQEELTDDLVYTWDNQTICSAINSRFQNKVTQVYSAYPTNHEDYKKCNGLIIVPTEDFTATMASDQTIIKKSPNTKFDLLIGKFLEKDFTAPSINGTIHLSVNVSNQPSIETILSYVQAIDETDGVVPIQVVEEGTTYIPGEMAIGDYVLKISATDSSSNTAYETIYIHRFDSDKPVISGTRTYTVNYNNDLTLDKIKAALSITDNIDKDLTLNLVSDNFTANKNKLGTYQIVFNTKDRSNNTSDNFTIIIVVRNEGTPVITAPTEITISISKLLTLEELKSKVSVIDGYDGVSNDYTIEGYDSYASSYTQVGTNDIVISKTNSGSHTATATVRFIKIDDVKPVLYFNNGYFVSLAEGETFTLDMFVSQAAAVLCLDIDDIISVEGYYDTDVVGYYDVMVCLASGEEENFRVVVGEEVKPAETTDILEEPKKNFGNQVKDFYQNNSTVAWCFTGLGIFTLFVLIVAVVFIIKKHK